MSICIFGDSITWGANDIEKGGWVERLKIYIGEKYEREVYNLGISGDNSDKLLKRFEHEAKVRKPDLIIFSIGTNDSQYIETKNNPRVSKINFADNLKTLVQQAKRLTDNIAFVGLLRVDEGKVMPIPWSNENKFYDNQNMREYDAIIQSIAQESELSFLNLSELLSNEDFADGLHPNSQGHQKIFEAVKAFLSKHQLIAYES